MKVSINKITSAIGKISDLTSGDKTIPGVLLDLSENSLKICYSDGHKSLIEKLEVETEEGDFLGQVVVDFTQIARAVANCQPSGSIKVSDVTFSYNLEKHIINVSIEQMFNITDNDGNVVSTKKMGTKKMDLLWTEPGSDMKSSILTRMKYDEIFDSETTDEFDKKELMDALSKTSVEKGKPVYMSSRTQTVFVANQAHVTSVPVSKLKTLSVEEKDEIRAELTDTGAFTDEAFAANIAKAENRIHFAVAMTQNIAKSLIGVLGKTSSDKVYLYTKDKYCNIFIDNADETVGVWFEMAQASKAHTGALDRYASMQYQTYQTMFVKEFLDNNIKSALNATKSEKVLLKFEDVEDEFGLTIMASSSSASVADTYRIIPNNVIDTLGDIKNKSFSISLKVLSDMIAQLKTEYVSLDIDVSADGNVCIRLSEVNYGEFLSNYMGIREKTKTLCAEQNIEFTDTTPTPVELQLTLRNNALITKQYTMLGK